MIIMYLSFFFGCVGRLSPTLLSLGFGWHVIVQGLRANLVGMVVLGFDTALSFNLCIYNVSKINEFFSSFKKKKKKVHV